MAITAHYAPLQDHDRRPQSLDRIGAWLGTIGPFWYTAREVMAGPQRGGRPNGALMAADGW